MGTNDMAAENETGPWWSGITRYQWLVLLIASLGWVFDVFEGQIFVASMREAMPSLAPNADEGTLSLYNNIALAAFLLGGALGGIFFGVLSDKIGRKKTMSLTILFYSLFTCISAFSAQWWHLVSFRFLVALGVGGEWAVASALVAEVFPRKARAYVGSIFHASSVLGTYLAIAVSTFFIGSTVAQNWVMENSPSWIANFTDPSSLPWRLGFAVGVLPALLIIWIRMSLKEPEGWVEAKQKAKDDATQQVGRLSDLFSKQFAFRTFLGMTLSAIGLATFWGIHIYGKNLMLEAVAPGYYKTADSDSNAKDETRTANWNRIINSIAKNEANQASKTESSKQFELSMSQKYSHTIQFLTKEMDITKIDFDDYQTIDNDSEKDKSLKKFNFLLAAAANKNLSLPDSTKSNEETWFFGRLKSCKNALSAELKRWEMLGMLIVTTGGGIGLLLFGPLSERLGRVNSFVLFHLFGFVLSLVAFNITFSPLSLYLILPIFGFFTLGMHAGYAIYFPELFPTRLRGTGTGFCFNSGRFLAAPLLLFYGIIQQQLGITLNTAVTGISFLYLAGAVLILFGPETKGKELPE